MPDPVDEFGWIATLRALTRSDPRALDLNDDAAVIPGRPGFDIVVSKDAMVEGVHFPPGEAPNLIARRLLRTGLSDLAAKAAEPFGYFLLTAWPAGRDSDWRDRFRAGLEADGRDFNIALLGGDTVATQGPLVLSVTVLGWVEAGRAVLRSGAKAGHALVVCGTIGDGWLGLKAVRGEIEDSDGSLRAHFRLPTPLFNLRPLLLKHVRACADVSDGLVADAGHIAEASNLGVTIELASLPTSNGAANWLGMQTDQGAARLALATGGDDYALACAIDRTAAAEFVSAVRASGVQAEAVGVFVESSGVRVTAAGKPIPVLRSGWSHSNPQTGDPQAI